MFKESIPCNFKPANSCVITSKKLLKCNLCRFGIGFTIWGVKKTENAVLNGFEIQMVSRFNFKMSSGWFFRNDSWQSLKFFFFLLKLLIILGGQVLSEVLIVWACLWIRLSVLLCFCVHTCGLQVTWRRSVGIQFRGCCSPAARTTPSSCGTSGAAKEPPSNCRDTSRNRENPCGNFDF